MESDDEADVEICSEIGASAFAPAASVTWTVKENEPETVGAPPRRPAGPSVIVIPAGTFPETVQ